MQLSEILPFNSDIEVIKLMLEQEKTEALNLALVDFKKEAPAIEKKELGFNLIGEQFEYAKIEEIQEQIDPILTDKGLTYSFAQRTRGEIVQVTCTVTHTKGGSKSVSMSSVKHAAEELTKEQQTAVTTSYLKRYTLTNVLGLVLKNEDKDGCHKGQISPLGIKQPPKTRKEQTDGLREAVRRTEKRTEGERYNPETMEIIKSPAVPAPEKEKPPVSIPLEIELEDEEMEALVGQHEKEWTTVSSALKNYMLQTGKDKAECSELHVLAEEAVIKAIWEVKGFTTVMIEAEPAIAEQFAKTHDWDINEVNEDDLSSM